MAPIPLVDELTSMEADPVRLDAERARAAERLATLRARVASPPTAANVATESTIIPARITLFRSFFRGREDVHATRWVSKKTGKSGWSPACTRAYLQRLWREPGLWMQPRPPEVLLPLTDAAIRDHLEGRAALGIYPLLRDGTCWFLAVDFDGKKKAAQRNAHTSLPPEIGRTAVRRARMASTIDWWADAQAFATTCVAFGVPVALERSRSGKGAHAWMFFSEPVLAVTARTLGSFIITETMERRHEISFASYDRLFPNQDTMPEGGFGSLIALPFQGDVAPLGNSVFLDARGQPYADQWAFLASLPRASRATVEAIAAEARQRGRIIGVRISEIDTDNAKPWERPSSRTPKRIVLDAPLPSAIRAIRAQRLFVPLTGLPAALCTAMKRLAAFQNPEFYAKQRMRLAVTWTPRIISCAEEIQGYLALPRGCEDEIHNLLRAHGSTLDIDDRTYVGAEQSWMLHGTLSDVQTTALDAILAHDSGVFVAPPGSGKTVVGIAAIAARRQPTLVLVHRKPLLEQWIAQLACFLGIPPDEIGRIGGGKSKPNGVLDVGMLQSLVRKGVVDDCVANYGHVVIDECHHLPAFSFEQVLAEARARYILGLTATPYRRDGHQPIIVMQCGPIRYAIHANAQAAARPFAHRLIIRETACALPFAATSSDHRSIHTIYETLAHDAARNTMIIEDVRASLAEQRTPIVLTERRDHLERLAELIAPHVQRPIVLKGGGTDAQRREAMGALAAAPKGEPLVILATGRYIGEGFDDARLDTLFLALPVSWRGTLVQYAGRLHRLHPDKREVRIYDYVDGRIPACVRMFDRRMSGYRTLGYEVVPSPQGALFARV